MSHMYMQYLACTLLPLAIVSCGNSDLDRSAAKEILSKHETFSTTREVWDVRLNKECLIEHGYIIQSEHGSHYNATAIGDKVLHRISADVGLYSLDKPVSIRLKEVTGISGDNNNKKVTFSSELVGAPDIIVKCQKETEESSVANFQRFDDGWRVVGVFIK